MNNPIQLTIGILDANPAWQSLLDQIGINWTFIELADHLSPTLYSVIIVNRPATIEENTMLEDYIRSGGAVLYTYEERQHVQQQSTSHRFITSIAPSTTKEYRYTEIFDFYGNAYTFGNNSLVATVPLDKGLSAYLGVDITALYSVSESQRKGFYTLRERLPHELVAKRTRSSARQIVQSLLEYLHHVRNLPFIHKWYYPTDHQTLFTFRIDSDKGTQLEIEEIFKLSELYSIPTTWFLDVKSHELWLRYFSKFKNQEIAVHCYEHSVYKSTLLNKENFDKALCLLRHLGMDPIGIAAPTGAWNTSLGKALMELDVEYSSEFAYDYDNLPSFPIVDGTFSPVVQLPVHPCCIGNMRREQMSPQEMMEYYFTVIDQKLHSREPICLYHHPGHGTNEVFQEVFRYINGKHLLKISYMEYARWWKRRHASTFTAQVTESTLTINGQNTADDTFVRISITGGKEAFTPVAATVQLNELPWSDIPSPQVVPHDILRARKTTIRHYIQNALDWWIKTTE